MMTLGVNVCRVRLNQEDHLQGYWDHQTSVSVQDHRLLSQIMHVILNHGSIVLVQHGASRLLQLMPSHNGSLGLNKLLPASLVPDSQ